MNSVEMDEVGTQGLGGRQDQERDNKPRRDDEQDQDRRSKQDQSGEGNRKGQNPKQENEEEN